MVTEEFPTPYEVLTRAYVPGRKNSHGMPIDAWAAPVRQRVYGWSAPTSTEPKLAGQNRVVVELELLVPESFVCGPHDRVVINSRELDVIGYAEDYNHGPFEWRPGQVVNLKGVEG